MKDSNENAKELALTWITRLRPGDEDVVEDGFDALADNRFRVPKVVTEHAFQVPAEVWAYALSVCAFVGAIVSDASKDVLKQGLSFLLSRAVKRRERLEPAEQEALMKAVEAEGARLAIPEAHRKELKADLRRLFDEGMPVVLTPEN